MVERLREAASRAVNRELLLRAADEIERLREERDSEHRAARKFAEEKEQAEACVKAERDHADRLAKALRDLADAHDGVIPLPGHCSQCDAMLATRAALLEHEERRR